MLYIALQRWYIGLKERKGRAQDPAQPPLIEGQMRLICPNCGAQYDVDASMIPESGRDVQCSNCGHGWFQHPEDPLLDDDDGYDALEAEETVSEDAPAPARPAGGSRLDPAVTDVLREEAELEAAQRRAETARPERPRRPERDDDAASQSRMARLRGLEETEVEDDAGPRKGLLPDVEEIDTSLRGRQTNPKAADPSMPELGSGAMAGSSGRGSGGFRAGFYLVLGLAVLAIAIYALAPQIAAAVPSLEPALFSYVEIVNGLRSQMNGFVELVVGRIRDLSTSIGS